MNSRHSTEQSHLKAVRLGMNAHSGHFVTLIAFPQEPDRPVIVLDSLTAYTLSDQRYINHLLKVHIAFQWQQTRSLQVAAVMLRRGTTSGVKLYFASEQQVPQQLANGNSCGRLLSSLTRTKS